MYWLRNLADRWVMRRLHYGRMTPDTADKLLGIIWKGTY